MEDRNAEMLPDSPDSDPREVLDYLRKHSGPDIPRWVLQADVSDALTLLNWLWWEDRRRELHFLKAGRSRGLFLTQLGAQVGVGKQGLLDRIDRLEALLRYDRPDEQITRSSRRLAREARQRRPAEDAWLDAHRDELVAVSAGLSAQADRYKLEREDRVWVDQLALDADDDELTAAARMAILGLAVAELRTAPAVLALDSKRPHAVHMALSRADRLRSRFAALDASAAASDRERLTQS
ncbi:hypothetical protein [Pseudonocardia sp. DSM 110487]|uniref:hypothetical protein n=1 Tax=Pseudonocardia sp. DSM 110487 TaxID=2865833 RepID=UPI00351D4817